MTDDGGKPLSSIDDRAPSKAQAIRARAVRPLEQSLARWVGRGIFVFRGIGAD